MKTALAALPALLAAFVLAGCAAAPTVVDSEPGGFAVYRSGWLDRQQLAALCRAGVQELVVLDGTAARRECRWRDEICPGLVVRYDGEQRAERPLEAPFLASFDAWVEEAREAGRKIAYRCRHGWHRAGRLTAWYRLRFSGWSAAEAREEMLRVGRFMGRHPYLEPQVEALADHLAGSVCPAGPEVCVRPAEAAARSSPAGAAPPRFPADVCP